MGSAFYRAVAIGLFGSEDCHLLVWNAVVSYVESNLGAFVDFYSENSHGEPINIVADLNNTVTPGIRGAESQLSAASRAFQRTITMLTPEYSRTYDVDSPQGQKVLVVFDRKSHYSGTPPVL